jgi:hypothetical protein
MSASVFISYASQDQKVASTLCKALEGRGYPCWIAARDIAPGENFQISIVRAIRSARIMLLVFTSNSNNSEEMAKELALASQSRLIVVPLRIEDVRQNDAFAYEFATRQWIDFFADWETAMEQLAQRISVALATEAVASPPTAPAPASQPAPTPDVIAAAIAAQPAEAAAARSPTLVVDPAAKTAVLSASELAAAAPSAAAASASAGPSSFQPSGAPKRGAPVMLFVAIGVLVVVAVAGAAVIAPSFLKKPAPPPAAVVVSQPAAPALSITPAPPPNPALVTQPTAVSPGPTPMATDQTPSARPGPYARSGGGLARTAQADAGAQEDPDLDPETHPARTGRRHPAGGGGGGSPDVPF